MDAELTQALKKKLGLQQLVGESPAFLAVIEKIPLVARTDATVLISGETGTGKEICARAIHYLSPRDGQPFVPVNCGAMPDGLVENELFGHQRGAYTGAARTQEGLISEADGGTLFLDEVDCLPLPAQVKLLRFLQEKEYRALGSRQMRKANVRVIAATNIDCLKAMREGRLRQDLYYRLNVIPLALPPLRERRDDIPLLARHFLKKYALESGKSTIDFAPEVLLDLCMYDWPGNVRELEYVVERAVVMSDQPVIPKDLLPLEGLEASSPQESFRQLKAQMIARFERTYIQNLLQAYQGNISKAARAAKKNRRAFFQLMRKHNMDNRGNKSWEVPEVAKSPPPSD